MRLTLPLPPSQNQNAGAHHMAKHSAKRKYQRAAWIVALEQMPPSFFPPERVRIEARFYLRNLRDDDNLAQSMKWPLDTLKARQSGHTGWRQGLCAERGYFMDDNPTNCVVEKPEQEIDRKNPRLELTIYAAG